MRRPRLLFVACVALLVIVSGRAATDGRAAAPPVISDSLLATVVGELLTIHGSALGGPAAARSLTFEYEGTSTVVSASSADVELWSPTEIRLTLPTNIRSGTVRVAVDGVSSDRVDLRVYMYSRIPVPSSIEENAMPLTLDVDASGRVWLIEEFHSALKALIPTTPVTSLLKPIPQPAAGIFASQIVGDGPTRVSGWGEDVDVAADGSIWFTQGGYPMYNGVHPNASRIVRYDPDSEQFSCYTSPVDNSEVWGVLVDDARGLVWYAESGFVIGNAISAFDPDTIASDCNEMPSETPAEICPGASVQPGCHARYVLTPVGRNPAHLGLDDAGDVWFTEFWGNSIGRLDPETGTFLRVPLAAPIVRAGPGIWVGAGPWELAWDSDGKLLVSEFFDATIVRVDTDTASGGGCSQLTLAGTNPCIVDVAVFSDGYDLKTLHSIAYDSDGLVWFALSGAPPRVGFVSPDGEPVMLPLPLADGGVGGIAEDPATGDIWFTQFEDKSVGRLQFASGDADGILDANDNCPLAYNPDQANSDRNWIDLAPYGKPFNDHTWPASDETGDACDGDMDNDGLPNDAELTLQGCPSASAPVDPRSRDTDGDRVLDGSECSLGSDPANAASRPVVPVQNDPDGDQLVNSFEVSIGTSPLVRDTDGDGLFDGVEYKNYRSDPNRLDGDGDGCDDNKEAASINGDNMVNSLDLLVIALSFGRGAGTPYVAPFDVNRDGVINTADIGLTAKFYGRC